MKKLPPCPCCGGKLIRPMYAVVVCSNTKPKCRFYIETNTYTEVLRLLRKLSVNGKEK